MCYKELQVAPLQDRLIQLPSAEEPELTEQGSEQVETIAYRLAVPLGRDDVSALLTLLAGIIAASDLFFTCKTVIYNQSTLRVSEQGQVTECFTRAIDQLRAAYDNREPQLEIRLGGIYALAEIAQVRHELFQPIIEVLAAYVRENASIDRAQQRDGAPPHEGRTPPRAPTDIQAILCALNLSALKQRKPVCRINLDRTDLRHSVLERCHLEGADLRAGWLE